MDSDNKKLTQLTKVTSLNDSDLFVVSIDVGTTPKTRAIKKSDAIVGGDKYPMEARLTLETGVPVSITDQIDKTTLYLTPYKGAQIATYDGISAWTTLSLSADLSLNVSAFTASKLYDIWVYNNAGSLALDSTVWTDATTRATALTRQNGVLVKTGATTRRYVGTIYMDAASKLQIKFGLTAAANGSAPKLYVYNEYNKVPVIFMSMDSTDNWAYTTGAYRAKNGSVGNSFIFINGNRMAVKASSVEYGANSGANGKIHIGFGYDAATTRTGTTTKNNQLSAGQYTNNTAELAVLPAVGLHYIQEIEYGFANLTYYGDEGDPLAQTGATYITEM